jgi:signal transduction histidine kinase
MLADPDRFEQVLINLLSNAVKFSPTGGVVSVRMMARDAGVCVAVTDQGQGIPEEFRPRLFQKFAQADGSDSRQKGGTGLGLSIAKALVENMGGQIGFRTEVGEGTTFYFELPEWRQAKITGRSLPVLGSPGTSPGTGPEASRVSEPISLLGFK